jgi:hypothetical protein
MSIHAQVGNADGNRNLSDFFISVVAAIFIHFFCSYDLSISFVRNTEASERRKANLLLTSVSAPLQPSLDLKYKK